MRACVKRHDTVNTIVRQVAVSVADKQLSESSDATNSVENDPEALTRATVADLAQEVAVRGASS